MFSTVFLFVVLLVSGVVLGSTPKDNVCSIAYSFSNVTYEFPSKEDEQAYISGGHYKNVTIFGVAVDSLDRIYVTMPRWKSNVPATLGYLIIDAAGVTRVKPFPNWEWNNITTAPRATRFSSVVSVLVDEDDNVWALDQGSRGFYDCDVEDGDSAILFKFDSGGNLVSMFEFGEDGRRYFLSDMALDTRNHLVYITNSGCSPDDGGSIIYLTMDSKMEVFKSISNKLYGSPATKMIQKTVQVHHTDNTTQEFTAAIGPEGISITGDSHFIVFSPTTSDHYYISTREWMMENNPRLLDLTRQDTYTGIVIGITGSLYGANINRGCLEVIQREDSGTGDCLCSMDFPSRVSFDSNGNILVVSSNLDRWINGSLDWDPNKVNFYVTKVHVGELSYLAGVDMGGDTAYNWIYTFPMWTVTALFLVYLANTFLRPKSANAMTSEVAAIEVME